MPTFGPFISSLTYFSEPSYIHASVQAPSTPCVEWVTVYLKPETEKDEWVKGLDALKEILGERQISAGWVAENERAFVVLIGWESKEEHLEWKERLTEQEVTQAMVMFRNEGVSKVEMCHVEVEQRFCGKHWKVF
jgi:heme-degrading monooxygenase HmoA